MIKTLYKSARSLLASLLTVDGAGSGLDADLLDGRQASDLYVHTGHQPGAYYFPISYYASVTTTETVLANELYLAPIIVRPGTIFTRIGVEVTTGSPGMVRLGIWNNGDAGLPGSLLLDAGEVATDTAGLKEITIAQQINSAIVWLGAVYSGTPAVRRSNTDSPEMTRFLGAGSPSSITRRLRSAFTYGPFPSDVSGMPIVGNNTAPQGIWLRVV